MNWRQKLKKLKPDGVNTEIDPEKLGGELIFTNSRLPVKSLFDNLEDGMSIEEFIYEYDAETEKVYAVLNQVGYSHHSTV